jgi:hypothetical protein
VRVIGAREGPFDNPGNESGPVAADNSAGPVEPPHEEHPLTTLPQVLPPVKPRVVRPAHGRARLTLTVVNAHVEQTYTVRPVPCDPGSGASKCYSLRKDDGTVYHCSAHDHGNECSCPDWIFNRDGLSYGPCKHLATLAAFGLLDGDPAREPGEDDDTDPLCPTCKGRGVIRIAEEAGPHTPAWTLCPRCTPAEGDDPDPDDDGHFVDNVNEVSPSTVPSPATGKPLFFNGTYWTSAPPDGRNGTMAPATVPAGPDDGPAAEDGTTGNLDDDDEGESDPADWPDWCDERWTVTDPSALQLPLADAIRAEADGYRARGNDLGDLLAEALEVLGRVARCTRARTVAELRDRAEVLS